LQAGRTALMYASDDGYTDVVRYLVCCGKAAVNTIDDVSVQLIR